MARAKRKKTAAQLDKEIAYALAGRKGKSTIEDDTPIIPSILAERAIASTPGIGDLDEIDRRSYAERLANKADSIYQVDLEFAKKIRARGNRGRDALYAYMQHWFASMLKKERPKIWSAVKRAAPGYGWSEVH